MSSFYPPNRRTVLTSVSAAALIIAAPRALSAVVVPSRFPPAASVALRFDVAPPPVSPAEPKSPATR